MSDDDFPDFAVADGIASARPHDLDDDILVDDHSLARRGLIGNYAEFSGGISLQHRYAARIKLCAQGLREGGPRNESALDRGCVLTYLGCRIEQGFQKIRGAGVSTWPQMGDCFHLLLSIADAARNDRAAKRVSPGFENESTGGKVIGKSIVHEVARAKPGGKERARGVPPVDAIALRLEDRTRGHQQALELCRRGYVKAAQGRAFPLALFEIRFAQHRKTGERRPGSNRRRIDTSKLAGPAGPSHGLRNEARQL